MFTSDPTLDEESARLGPHAPPFFEPTKRWPQTFQAFEHRGHIDREPLLFRRKIDQLRNTALHPEGHFVLRDRVKISGSPNEIVTMPIEFTERVQHQATIGGLYSRRIWKVQHRIATTSQCDPGVSCRQETARPHPVKSAWAAAVLVQVGVRNHE